MKTLRILAFGAALCAVSALPVLASSNEDEGVGSTLKGAAETTGQAIKEGAEATGHAVKRGAEEVGEFFGITSTEAARYTANERGEHRMIGTVSSIDHASGVIDVKTAEAPLQLWFPPQAVGDLKQGDTITVEVGYAMADTAASEKAYDEPREPATKALKQGENWMKGSITAVNHETGIVSLSTDKAGTLKLHFPPAEIRTLKAGDRIAVEMAFQKGRHLEKVPTQG